MGAIYKVLELEGKLRQCKAKNSRCNTQIKKLKEKIEKYNNYLEFTGCKSDFNDYVGTTSL
ncbi:hypothetical protein KKC91_11000 [bacterium]|nr:hypothetical protein [bacterium]